MHELVLQTPYPLPPQRHSQLLSIFAGVCGMQPVPYLEKHLIFRPNRRPGEEKVELVGGSQAVKTGKKGKKEGEGEVYYLKLVGSRDIPVETGKRDHTQVNVLMTYGGGQIKRLKLGRAHLSMERARKTLLHTMQWNWKKAAEPHLRKRKNPLSAA